MAKSLLNEQQRKAVAISAAAETLGRPLSPAALKMYVEILAEASVEDVERACAESLRTNNFLPAPAKLLEMSGLGSVTPDDRAMLAWESVCRAVTRYGAYKHVSFDDPIINAAIRNIGGWPSICERSHEEFETWTRKEFLRAYVAFLRSGVSAESCEPLPGLSQAGPVRMANGEVTYRIPPVHVVATGLPWAGEAPRRLESRKPTPTMPARIEFKKP